MAKTKTENYRITVAVHVLASIEIVAGSYEDALTQARQIEAGEFVPDGYEFDDGSISVAGLDHGPSWASINP
jgi:hypothetical protein